MLQTSSTVSKLTLGENQDSCKQKAKTSEVDPDFDGAILKVEFIKSSLKK